MKTTTQKHATRRNGPRTPAMTRPGESPRFALYARVSTDEQAEHGNIDAQVEYLQKRAALDALPVVDVYTDDGISGTMALHDRPDGARLLVDAHARRFDAVLVYRVDRFARSLRVLLDGYTLLEEAGVVFKSATEPFDTSTPMGKFLFQLLGSMAELDRATLLERMHLGRDRAAQHGKWTSGPIPLGYMLTADKYLRPSDRMVEELGITEADMIRDLFHRLAHGSSGIREAERLTSLGVPLIRRYGKGKSRPSARNQWYPSCVLRIIASTVYYGVHTLKSRFCDVTRTVPALVSRELWERANQQVQRNLSLPRPHASRVYLLRGLITCSLCERTYVGQRVSPESRPNSGWYYRCNGQNASGAPHPQERCKNRAVLALPLEDRLWARCRHFILHPQATLEAMERQLQVEPGVVANVEERERALTQQLTEKRQDEERLLTVFRRGRITMEAYDRGQEAIEAERETIERELAHVRKQRSRQTLRHDYAQRIRAVLGEWREELARIEADNDREAMQRLIADLVVGITVSPEGIEVEYHIEDPAGCVEGSAMVHSLHPTQRSSRITLAPTGEMVMASTGQATMHQASSYWVQV